MSYFADDSRLIRKDKEVLTKVNEYKDKKRKRRSYVASSGTLKGRGLVERLKRMGW